MKITLFFNSILLAVGGREKVSVCGNGDRTRRTCGFPLFTISTGKISWTPFVYRETERKQTKRNKKIPNSFMSVFDEEEAQAKKKKSFFRLFAEFP